MLGTILGKRVVVPGSDSFLSEESDTDSLLEIFSFVSQSVFIVPFDMVAIILQLLWSFVSPFRPGKIIYHIKHVINLYLNALTHCFSQFDPIYIDGNK